jgi:hypothetical protein
MVKAVEHYREDLIDSGILIVEEYKEYEYNCKY